jgi:peptidyl-prolyl cis-trans isomerase A (cyclophilin A)
MARSGDPHTADAQFYFNLADNLVLDPKPTRWGYAVFGTVIQGQEVIDAIGQRPTGIRDGIADVPLEPVVIRKVTIMDASLPR